MSDHPAASTGEHTGTTDDTHLFGPDGVAQKGFVVGVLITKTGAAGGTITLYDTSIADGAGAYAAEAVLVGPITVKTADAPFYIDLSRAKRRFANGIGADLSAVDLGVEVMHRS